MNLFKLVNKSKSVYIFKKKLYLIDLILKKLLKFLFQFLNNHSPFVIRCLILCKCLSWQMLAVNRHILVQIFLKLSNPIVVRCLDLSLSCVVTVSITNMWTRHFKFTSFTNFNKKVENCYFF